MSFTNFLTCKVCDLEGRLCPDDVDSFTCWKCSMRASEKVSQKHTEKLAEVTPEMMKKALKKRKWSRKNLAIHLNESAASINRMFRGDLTPTVPVYDWVVKQLGL